MEIKNKVAIVTGGIGGIGFKIVQDLLRHKAEYVAIVDIYDYHDQVVQARLKEIESEFSKDKVAFHSCSVTDTEKFTACYKEVLRQKKYVDILVNCAGIYDDSRKDLMIDINFKAVVNCTLVAVEHMGKHKGGKGGVVVNIGSTAGLVNSNLFPIYAATKHAVVSFVRSLKQHNEPLGVRIVCICPCTTDTNMLNFEIMKKSVLDFVNLEASISATSYYKQNPANVAAAVTDIIKKGKGGDVWVVRKDEPPFAVGEITDLEKMRI